MRAEPIKFGRTSAGAQAGLRLEWEGDWVLQTAGDVQGPWTDLAFTNRSLALPVSDRRAFFRLEWSGR